MHLKRRECPFGQQVGGVGGGLSPSKRRRNETRQGRGRQLATVVEPAPRPWAEFYGNSEQEGPPDVRTTQKKTALASGRLGPSTAASNLLYIFSPVPRLDVGAACASRTGPPAFKVSLRARATRTGPRATTSPALGPPTDDDPRVRRRRCSAASVFRARSVVKPTLTCCIRACSALAAKDLGHGRVLHARVSR